MSLDLTSREMELAEKASRRIGSRWSAVEVEDLTSFLYLWLVEHHQTLTRWREEPYGDGKLYVTLKREAAKYCAGEQAARVGRPIHADNFYTVELLSRAMPYLFEDVAQTTITVDPRNGAPQKLEGNWNEAVTIMADIRGAYHGLHVHVRQVLALRFRDGLTYEEIGDLRGLTKDGALKQVQRALDRLSNALSGQPL
jgi:DNA-directed RNA polymerase specialized sigma24 family protein